MGEQLKGKPSVSVNGDARASGRQLTFAMGPQKCFPFRERFAVNNSHPGPTVQPVL
jgi:hypothetical protein